MHDDRRAFLRTTGGLLLGGFLLGCGTSARDSDRGREPNELTNATDVDSSGRLLEGNQPGRKLGVALVGLGYYSREQLAPALQLTQHCELRGIVTGSPEKVPVWQDRYGIEDQNVYSYETFDRIADNGDIDVIYIVLPTSMHAEYSIRAARAGKHVWCEKPMAMNVAECRSVIEACEQAGVKLSIGYRMQHEPVTRKVMEWSGTLPYGPIENVRAAAGYAGSGQGTGWRWDPTMGGGALYDMGVYSINALRYATGQNPIAVRNVRQNIPNRVDVTTEFELIFNDGLTANGWTSVVNDRNRLQVDCANGWYAVEPMQAYSGIEGSTSGSPKLPSTGSNQQARQMDDDALAIMGLGPLLVPGAEGLRDIAVVEAIQTCARTEEEVEIIVN